jgi:hypothetical protein
MKIFIEGAVILDDDRIWKAEVNPNDFKFLGTCQNSIGRISVILVMNPIFIESQNRLEFEPSSAQILNIGNSTKTIIIGMGPEAKTPTGDDKFLEEIRKTSPKLLLIGEKLLFEVRRNNPLGELKSTESGKFVETPDNYWTVKIQPRNQSLRITVRGRPHEFDVEGDIDIKADRPGYSGFKINEENQLNSALLIMKRAKRK